MQSKLSGFADNLSEINKTNAKNVKKNALSQEMD